MRFDTTRPIKIIVAVLASLLLLGGCGAAPAPGPDLGPHPAQLATPPTARPATPPPPAQLVRACTDEGESCAEQFDLSPASTLTVYRNYPLSGNTGVTAAVVVIHGTERNASGYFSRMLKAASLADADQHTLVAAPWFASDEDDPESGAARWTNDGWKAGDDAVRPRGLSSFTAMDQLLTRLGDKSKFPNLTRITVAGHSAGGQFTQRYAASGQAPSALPGVTVNFVVANPSSYLYPIPERPNRGGTQMIRPSKCADYDEYKYGLINRPPYLSGLSAQQIIANLTSRRVTYLLGESDTKRDHDLDTDCGARAQGKNRFQRGTFYFNWIHRTYPSAPHDRIVVPGTAHESDEMFQSPQARPVLFGGAAPTG
jgi:pimeloyl-ACP methyl ester carboxylesterase